MRAKQSKNHAFGVFGFYCPTTLQWCKQTPRLPEYNSPSGQDMTRSIFAVVVCVLCVAVRAFYEGEFLSEVWVADDAQELDATTKVSFIVSLTMRNVAHMHDTLQAVSDPTSASYGHFLSMEEIDARYGPTKEDRQKVLQFFKGIDGAEVDADHFGDMFAVTAPVASIHSALNTKLGWVKHHKGATDKKAVRALKSITIPKELHSLIKYVSLNVPVNHAMPSAAMALKNRREKAMIERNIETLAENFDQAQFDASDGAIGISPGNEEALLTFRPFCGPTATDTNTENPPCQSANAANTPTFTVLVSKHNNVRDDTYLISDEPVVVTVPTSAVYCYNTTNSEACSGGTGGGDCNCVTKISSLPKYTQLRVNVTASYTGFADTQALGTSNLFALTDVATAHFLSNLYSIPQGMSVQHGSNQSVIEFYGEFYSNSDLMKFLSLSGLPNATIPVENVYGDLPNDQNEPGGEAQLDVEYIMALAPNAETYFYSFSDLNPYDPINEGFLAYLYYVGNQTNPPLVHSISYGDVEANIFNASNPGSIQYGESCDQQFMKLGLRGVTVLISSGDDGIGSSGIRDDPVGSCQQSVPEWPAGSPYITSVGATQMTDKYLPVCGQDYALSSAYPGMPVTNQLNFQCTGTAETVCTSTFGGVITSGGGFSDVSDRNATAPWQNAAVAKYLSASNAAAYPSPAGYFNKLGRAYPDIATYGSNYFVYLGGRITRESGTSASAPVMAAMVTLWNDMRLAYGMPPMGFIAPFLYYVQAKNPDAFNDITTGNNACGAGYSMETVNCCEQSFAASPGWDAVTGLGSPNFQIISNLVLNNATAFPNVGAYPVGTAAVAGDNNDDDEVLAISGSALGVGIAAMCVALVAVSLAIYLCVGRGKGGNSAGSSAQNPMNSAA